MFSQNQLCYSPCRRKYSDKNCSGVCVFDCSLAFGHQCSLSYLCRNFAFVVVTLYLRKMHCTFNIHNEDFSDVSI